jgi:hypothetical protein
MHFLKENKKTSAYYFNLYSNFINFTIKLFKVKKDPNRYNLKNFKKELQNSENVAKKKWLIEQANEIEKSLF